MTAVVANGITLEVERHGPKDAPPLVLIRGLGSQLIHWPPDLIEGFVDAGFHVVTFDNRDAGLSQKMDAAPDYTLADMADDTVGLMDALAIGSAHILGMSMGGMVTQLMALRHPHRVRSATIVMSSSCAEGLSQARPGVQAALTATAPSPNRADVVAHELATGRLWQSPAWPFDASARAAVIGRAWDRCHCPDGTARQYRAVQAAGADLAGIEAIAVPTLVVHGLEDALLPPDHGRDIAGRIPGATLIEIAGMGHDLEGDVPRILLAHVVRFLETLAGAAPVPKE